MKTLIALALLSVLAPVAAGEEWNCAQDCGCNARRVEDGVMVTTAFRKGDIVSTEAGWVVTPDDGWEKVRQKRDAGSKASSSSYMGTLPGGNLPGWLPSTTPAPEVGDGSVWTLGGVTITANVSPGSQGGVVELSVTDGSGTSGITTGSAGPTSNPAHPTCDTTPGLVTVPGGRTFTATNGKMQRRNRRGQWVDMRQVSGPVYSEKDEKQN